MASEIRQVPHWFADTSNEEGEAHLGWQPCLDTGEDHIPCFDAWFASKEACEDWIRTYVLGATLDATP